MFILFRWWLCIIFGGWCYGTFRLARRRCVCRAFVWIHLSFAVKTATDTGHHEKVWIHRPTVLLMQASAQRARWELKTALNTKTDSKKTKPKRNKFKKTSLLRRKDFYLLLNQQNISKADYKHTQSIWQEFEMKSIFKLLMNKIFQMRFIMHDFIKWLIYIIWFQFTLCHSLKKEFLIPYYVNTFVTLNSK